MDAQLKAKWVEALRSDRYRQTDGMLRFDETDETSSYCCLGVLCDVMGATWVEGEPLLDDLRLQDPDEAYLSAKARQIAGLSDPTQHELAALNDQGKTFAEIADHIEANL